MLSDEEKKAIEVLQYVKNKTPFIFWYEDKPYNRKETINTILNLIEKQFKEIEELKEKNKFLNWYFENQKDNFVHKDKIKAKIEELEIEQESNREDLKIAIDNLLFQNIDKIENRILINMSVREILQSLLGKE